VQRPHWLPGALLQLHNFIIPASSALTSVLINSPECPTHKRAEPHRKSPAIVNPSLTSLSSPASDSILCREEKQHNYFSK
jgi:hypothetical protein